MKMTRRSRKSALRRVPHRRNRGKRLIKITFDKHWTDESTGEIDSESGWIDDEGVEISLDRYDISEGLTIAKKVANYLLNEGVYEASSSHYDPHGWYNTSAEQDYRTGAYESRSYHLDGFSEPERREIFRLVMKRGR